MAKFLNIYMKKNRNVDCDGKQEMERIFIQTASTILNKIGKQAFKPQNAVNAAVLDAVMVGVASRLQNGAIKNSLKSQYDKLLNNADFIDAISEQTSHRERVQRRLKLAIDAFSDTK